MKAWSVAMFFVVSLVFFAVPASAHESIFRVLQVRLNGAISPAQDDLLSDSLRYANDLGYDLVLLVLDTPGGLGDSMRSMVQTMLNAPLPVAVWVGPSGAHAASAGVFLVAASSVAAMAPQTTLGAASPVGLGGGDIPGTMAKKIQQDFTSLVQSVARAHGRNSEWYGRSVTESASISAADALHLKVVEFIAPTVETFLDQLGQHGLSFKGSVRHFSAEIISVKEYDPGFRYRFLSWLLHPQIAYLLLMAGILGLFIELTHPGTFLPGVVGGISLVLALYAMSVLPTNIAGLLLIGFSLVLFLLEIKVVSYGMLTLAGLVSMVIGSLILFRDEYGTIQIPLSSIIWAVLSVVLVFGSVTFLVLRSKRQQGALGETGMVGLTGKVIEWGDGKGKILVRGEIWAVKGVIGAFSPSVGAYVRIESINGLTLKIGPINR
ncbi:NfeD family protein [Pseudodesulfovibrio piezophilus]|uniref:Uncharacterized protein n=1 Tax=Pseudodesulfovibrio piezophilus (strain DSM 21447 / JCM 15486 / C1TLV30) TaxID=1322246 RepID=M1WTC7_PSEP2|nr:nodulation protein NfeD [Pseudodesulfovibrio piezophilus]CCH49447.1 conserved membrane protein of unknown function [Pseudodesulfovibrio piezophilus C1TLV30]